VLRVSKMNFLAYLIFLRKGTVLKSPYQQISVGFHRASGPTRDYGVLAHSRSQKGSNVQNYFGNCFLDRIVTFHSRI
jgi:hypothetical protein